jgi:hypothetical protein
MKEIFEKNVGIYSATMQYSIFFMPSSTIERINRRIRNHLFSGLLLL